MLWYKAWFETRWRMLLPVLMIGFAFYQVEGERLRPGPRSVLNVLPLFWAVTAVVLAGSGIRTEAPFRAQKGMHGSMFFTLGLPVSRLRLLLERSIVGVVESSAVVVVMCMFGRLLIPAISTQVTAADGLAYLVTVLLAIFGFTGLSTLLSTVLDQQWQVFASMGAFAALKWCTQQGWLGSSVDVIATMGTASPLVTHQIYWTPLLVSVAAGVLFFFGAVQVVQRKEY